MCGVIAALLTRASGYLDDMVILPFFIILAAVISLMIGTEHSDGAMRNKIISGHTKGNVFLSQLIVYLVFAFVAAALYLGAFSIFMIGHVGAFPTYALIVSAIGFLLVSLSYTVILATLSMMISQKAVSAVICLLLVVATVLSIYAIDDALAQREFIYMEIEMGECSYTINEPNPRYIGGAARRTMEFIRNIIPYGPTLQYMDMVSPAFRPWDVTLTLSAEEANLLAILPMYSITESALIGAIGWLCFRKKELK